MTSEPRVEQWEARTRDPLDFIAIGSIWVIIGPFGSFGDTERIGLVILRIGVSAVFGVDYAIRLRLSVDRRRFARTHMLDLAAVFAPFVRVIFSLGLVRRMFTTGSLRLFGGVASLLVLNGAFLMLMLEQDHPDGTINSMGDALWWAIVTSTTVGYGDTFPVTGGGRLTAVALMGLGIVIFSMVTARVAASFGSAGTDDESRSVLGSTEAASSSTEVADRLARIEAHLEVLTAPDADGH